MIQEQDALRAIEELTEEAEPGALGDTQGPRGSLGKWGLAGLWNSQQHHRHLERVNHYREANWRLRGVPDAYLQANTLSFLALEPGEAAFVPVAWTALSKQSFNMEHCSIHPRAPAGLRVVPGTMPPTCAL